MSSINYKVINTYITNKEGYMAKIVNFVYSMVIFLSLFLVEMNAERKPFLSILIFLFSFIHNILSYFIYTCYSLFFIIGCNPCVVTCADDLLNRCPPGTEPICIYGVINCIPIGRRTNHVLTWFFIYFQTQ